MAYTESEARELIIRAGEELVKKKLVARTWGNISARISDTQFIITPSGKDYEDITAEDLVVVNISDLKYKGNVKPSSEKGIHASAYALRKDINFVIHTHQHYASAICAECRDVSYAPCAEYGLPGTKKLRKNVEKKIIDNPEFKSFLLAHHGALLLGETYEEAFELANTLEAKSLQTFNMRLDDGINMKRDYYAYSVMPWLDDFAQLYGLKHEPPKDEDKKVIDAISAKNITASSYVRGAKPISKADTLLMHTVYKLKYSKLKGKKEIDPERYFPKYKK